MIIHVATIFMDPTDMLIPQLLNDYNYVSRVGTQHVAAVFMCVSLHACSRVCYVHSMSCDTQCSSIHVC